MFLPGQLEGPGFDRLGPGARAYLLAMQGITDALVAAGWSPEGEEGWDEGGWGKQPAVREAVEGANRAREALTEEEGAQVSGYSLRCYYPARYGPPEGWEPAAGSGS